MRKMLRVDCQPPTIYRLLQMQHALPLQIHAYDELMTTGVSAYVRKACERDATLMATQRTASFEVARPNTGDEAAPVLPSGEFASMIQQLCLKIDSLTAEVGEL